MRLVRNDAPRLRKPSGFDCFAHDRLVPSFLERCPWQAHLGASMQSPGVLAGTVPRASSAAASASGAITTGTQRNGRLSSAQRQWWSCVCRHMRWLAVMVASRHVRQSSRPRHPGARWPTSRSRSRRAAEANAATIGGNDEIVTYRVGGLLPVRQFASNHDPLFAANHNPLGIEIRT